MTSDGVQHQGVVDLPSLTSLRWYAVLSVFLFHNDALLHWRPLRVFFWGQAGVTFFFILSGFVLTWSATSHVRAGDFYQRRFARVYPSHLVMTAVAGVLYLAVPELGTTGWLDLLAVLLLIQAWFPGSQPVYSFNAASWSLACEAFFYALFPAMRPRLSRLRTAPLVSLTAAVLAAGAVITALLAHAGHGHDIAYNNPVARIPEFLLGITLALLVARGSLPRVPAWLAAAVFAGGVVIAHGMPLYPLFDYALIPGFALIIVAGSQSDLAGKRGLLQKPASVYLGRVSFCFYLTHVPCSGLLTHLLGTNPAMLLLTFCTSLATAAALHHVVELPAQRSLRPKRRRLDA